MSGLANTLTVLSGGFRTAWFWLNDQDGYFAGTTGSLTPGAAGQGAYLMTGVKTAAYKAIEPLVLLGTGEDQPQGQIVEPPQTLQAFDMTSSIGDLGLDSLQQNTKTFAQGNMTFGAIQSYLPNYVAGGVLFTRLSISKDAATNGQPNFDGVLYPKIQAVPLSSDGMAEKKTTDWKRHIIVNPSSVLYNGQPVNAASFGTSQASEFPFTTPQKVLIYAWKGDGSTTAFNLPTSAIPTSGLLAPGFSNTTLVEGTVTAPASVALVSTNYVFTFSVAPLSGKRIVTTVEYL